MSLDDPATQNSGATVLRARSGAARIGWQVPSLWKWMISTRMYRRVEEDVGANTHVLFLALTDKGSRAGISRMTVQLQHVDYRRCMQR